MSIPDTKNATEKPTPPKPWDCCGGGCSPCVWDTYYNELHIWNMANGITEEKINLVDNDPDYR